MRRRLPRMLYTHDDLSSLGHKLDSMPFTDGERAALQAIVERAGGIGDEVSGFARPTFGQLLPRVPLGGDEIWVKQPKPLGGDDPGWVKQP